MNIAIRAFATAVSVVLVCLSACVQTREQRELKIAEGAILTSIAISASPAGRDLCAREPLACAGASKSILALALIGSRKTASSVTALVGLLRFQMDGALAEDYECYVLMHAGPSRTLLEKANPKELETWCRIEVKRLASNDPLSFKGLATGAVCSTQARIQDHIRELLAAIHAGRRCGPGEF